MKNLCLGLIAFSLGAVAMAQNTQKVEQLDSVVIDTKIRQPRKQSGKIVAVIDSSTLERFPGKTVAAIINEVSGIEINGSRSNDGQNLGYFVRGGRNRQVLILIDGVAVNDASSIATDYDLRLMDAAGIERIEILKGASSVLYGSAAATAVINITTKKISGRPFALDYQLSMGSNQSAEEERYQLGLLSNRVQLSGKLQKFHYRLSFSHRFTDQLSAIAAQEGESPFESDTFNRFNTRLDLGYQISEYIEITRFVGIDNYMADFDGFDYSDADNRSLSKQYRLGGNLEWQAGKLQLVVNDQHNWIEREMESSFPAKFEAQTSSVDAFGSYPLLKSLSLMAGVNVQRSEFDSFTIPFGETEFNQDVSSETAKFRIIDPYLNFNFSSETGLNVNAGARWNTHSNYDAKWVYAVNPSYNFKIGNTSLKLLASYSTAYISPSLFQLYDPLYGNEDLVPEENATLEGGFEWTYNKKSRISFIYFSRDEENFIDFVTVDPDNFLFQYQNISEAFNASGFELEWKQHLWNVLLLQANYTNTQVAERFKLRVPEHKVNAALAWEVDAKTELGLTFSATSERRDAFFNPETFSSEEIKLGAYQLFDFSFSRQLNPQLRLTGAITNLLNEEYEELYRYQSKGRNWVLGLSLQL